MTESEAQSIARYVVRELENSRTISSELHNSHHRWIEHKIKKEKQREDMWNRVKSTAIGGLLVTTGGGLVAFLVWVAKFFVKAKGG